MDAETFATWANRADEILLRGEKSLARPGMSARAVPFHCPYCGDENLFPHDPEDGTAHGAWNAAPACGRSRSA